ncbi:MAG: dihydroorotate dehydrogenase-like protein [Bacteroidales bacterium]|nr:dihydroorotate dehydrogenase-like protein [Bacteroidales bacterium]
MADLSTKYGSLKLKSPVIAGSSGLTDNIENMIQLEKAGAGAIVLKSLFEEEILKEMDIQLGAMGANTFIYPETVDFYDYYDGPRESTTTYLELVRKAKTSLAIPVIASINCMDAQNWTYFPGRLEEAGADAVELNIFNIPSDLNKSSEENEKIYFEIIREVQKQTKLPLFVKLSYYSSSLATFLRKVSESGVDGMILFNRFYNPDIDINKLELTNGGVLSTPGDIYQSLRWIAIMAKRVDCSLIASTGVHDAHGLIRQLLAGADAVQVASTLYTNGIPYLSAILNQLEEWMNEKGYSKLDDFKGMLCQSEADNPAVFSRTQFMKYFRGFPKS